MECGAYSLAKPHWRGRPPRDRYLPYQGHAYRCTHTAFARRVHGDAWTATHSSAGRTTLRDGPLNIRVGAPCAGDCRLPQPVAGRKLRAYRSRREHSGRSSRRRAGTHALARSALRMKPVTRMANDVNADLILICRGDAPSALLETLRQSLCPVLIVQPSGRSAAAWRAA
jgi:hypothetical protein